jgi:hypothetical protein
VMERWHGISGGGARRSCISDFLVKLVRRK